MVFNPIQFSRIIVCLLILMRIVQQTKIYENNDNDSVIKINNLSFEGAQTIKLQNNQGKIIENNKQLFLKRIDQKTGKEILINLNNIPNSQTANQLNTKSSEKQDKLQKVDLSVAIQTKSQKPLKSLDEYQTLARTIKSDVPSQIYSQWGLVEVKNEYPSPRKGHSIVSTGHLLIIFGGCNMEIQCFDDLIFYDLNTNKFEFPKTTGKRPPSTSGHSATLHGSKMFIFGGAINSDLGFTNAVYAFDLETQIWEILQMQGQIPVPRAYHKAVLGKNGIIYVFGGYIGNLNSHSNEFYELDTINQRWYKPIITGRFPSPREQFTMNLVDTNQVWIFGGYGEGNNYADLHVLLVDSLQWIPVNVSGSIPSARSGHAAIVHGKSILITGGCSLSENKCYSQTFQLDTTHIYFQMFNEPITSNIFNPPLEGMQLTAVDSKIYSFGGCSQKSCTNDLFVFDTGEYCPNNCYSSSAELFQSQQQNYNNQINQIQQMNSNTNTCRDRTCKCGNGFQGNDCSETVHCKENCLERGVCKSTGKCSCFPGHKGPTCAILVPCPMNCTNEINGLCQDDGTCKCNTNFKGKGCEIQQSTILHQKINCSQETAATQDSVQQFSQSSTSVCSNHGQCDMILGVCNCFADFTGDDCSEPVVYENIDDIVDRMLPPVKDHQENLTEINWLVPDIMDRRGSSDDEYSSDDLNFGGDESDKSSDDDDDKDDDDDVDKDLEFNITTTNATNVTTTNITTKVADMQQTVIQKFDRSFNRTKYYSKPTIRHKITGNLDLGPVNHKLHAEMFKRLLKSEQPLMIPFITQEQLKAYGVIVTPEQANKKVQLTDDEEGPYVDDTPSRKQLQPLGACKNHCSYRGICQDGKCYCSSDTIGEDCSQGLVDDSSIGVKNDSILYFGMISTAFGLLVCLITLFYLSKNTEEAEFESIKQDDVSMLHIQEQQDQKAKL